jgi:hypothetical protein
MGNTPKLDEMYRRYHGISYDEWFEKNKDTLPKDMFPRKETVQEQSEGEGGVADG